MRRHLVRVTLAIVLVVGFAAMAAAQDITPLEREKASHYLRDTRDGLTAAVKGLSAAQWKFKPAPDRWSIAEVMEHLATIETLFANNLTAQLMQSPAGKPGTDVKAVDAMVLAKVPDRSVKAKAPEMLVPTGRWTPGESIEHFLAGREQTTAFLTSSANLRGHVMNHPALGPLDAYEWVLAIAAHTERHTKQILEVKADPNFPAN